MDRETRDQYVLVIQAKDMVGQMGGLSGTTSVTVTLTDVNDNPPRFSHSKTQPARLTCARSHLPRRGKEKGVNCYWPCLCGITNYCPLLVWHMLNICFLNVLGLFNSIHAQTHPCETRCIFISAVSLRDCQINHSEFSLAFPKWLCSRALLFRREALLMIIQSTGHRVSTDSPTSVRLTLSPPDGRGDKSIYGTWRDREV